MLPATCGCKDFEHRAACQCLEANAWDREELLVLLVSAQPEEIKGYAQQQNRDELCGHWLAG